MRIIKSVFRALAPLAFAALLWSPQQAFAQEPTARLPEGIISVTNNKIQITRVPIQDARGRVRHWDLEIDLLVRRLGRVVIPRRNVTQTLSPRVRSAKLRPGRYRFGIRVYTLSTTGTTDGGRAIWSFTNDSCINMVLIGGPIDGHPTLEERLNNAEITLSALTYGAVGSSSGTSDCLNFTLDNNDLLGLQNTPDALILNDFTSGGDDSDLPIRTFSLARCPDEGDCV